MSTTYTAPAESVAMPVGPTLNWPSPVPDVPHLVRKAPVELNFCTRLLKKLSVT